MKLLYWYFLFFMSLPVGAMEDLEEILADFIPSKFNQQSIPLIPEKDRVMANLSLMTIPFGHDSLHSNTSRRKRVRPNYNEDSEAEQPAITIPRVTCGLCNATFARKDGLALHQKTKHEEPEKFPCSINTCSSSFAYRSHLYRHLTRVHKLNPKTLKPFYEKKEKKNSSGYQTNSYRSLADLNAGRRTTRSTQSK